MHRQPYSGKQMRVKLVLLLSIATPLCACSRTVTLDKASATVDSGKLELVIHGNNLDHLTYGGYIHLFLCGKHENERYFPVEHISKDIVSTSLSSHDRDWLRGTNLQDVCVTLFDESRIGIKIESNTVPLANYTKSRELR